MKLPFEFSTKNIFRLIVPGVILAAAMVPLFHWAMHFAGVRIKFEYLFPAEVIGWGWLIAMCDMHIYMLFEGRRYWPKCLHEWMCKREEKGLQRIQAQVKDNAPKPRSEGQPVDRVRRWRYLEGSVRLRTFPKDEHGNFFVQYPTRLGNTIASFEHYPFANYGIDSVFYWYRLWIVLDKDLREELDNAQALVDSTVYVACVLYVSGVLMFLYAAIGTVGLCYPSVGNVLRLPYVPSANILVALGIACFLIAGMIYNFCLHAHTHYGELYKSMFDQYRSKIELDDVIKIVARVTNDPMLPYLKSRREKYRIALYYLQWGRAWDDVEKRYKTVAEWQKPSAP